MKKLFLTVTILFGMTLGAYAEWSPNDSGWNLFHLFNFDEEEQEEARIGLFEDTEIFGTNWNDIFESSNSFINYEEGGMFCRAKAKDHLFDFNFSMHEAFAATNSETRCVQIIEQAAKNLELPLGRLEQPFRWSEDFGRFGGVCPIGFFGLGSGTEQPALHNPEFDFPDDILETGMTMFWEIIRLELEG